MGSRKFQRYYIVLNEEDIQYRFSGKAPTGYCKIEVRDGKGKSIVYVQNVKPLDDEVYKVYMLCPKKEKVEALYMGALSISEAGRGETQFAFDPLNVAGTGVPLQEVQGVVVAVDKDQQESFFVPLAGYIKRSFAWKGKIERVEQRVEEEQEERIEEKIEEAAEEKIVEKIEETAEEKIEEWTEGQVSLAVPMVQPEEEKLAAVEQSVETVQYEEIEQEDMQFEDVQESSELPEDQYDVYRLGKQPWGSREEDLEERSLSGNEQEEDVEEVLEELIRCSCVHMGPYQKQNMYWVKIDPQMLQRFTKNWKMYSNHPYISMAYKRFKYLLLGVEMENEAVKRYYIGIPGVYNPYEEQIYKPMGYKNFYMIPGHFYGYGHWILQLS